MATTTYGTPYVTSADLVSNWPAASLTVANSVDAAGYYIGRGLNAQTASYTLVLTDAGKTVTMTVGTANVLNIPTNASVAFPTGTRVNVINLGAGATTVTALAGVTINGTVAALASNSAASIIKTATNTWSYVPFSSGVGNAVYSDANTGTYTGYAYKTFTASGTLTVTTAGFADLVICAGGGGGGNSSGGAGAGGVLVITNAYLPVGTLTVTVGAGGAGGALVSANASGLASRVGSYFAMGGGTPVDRTNIANQNGSGAGGQYGSYVGTSGITGMGFNGGDGGSNSGVPQGSGGGGGAAAVGSNGTNGVGGAGGAGTTTTIAGTTPSGAYVAGSYALGGGGGGFGSSTGGAGGSGGGGAGSSGSGPTAGTVNTGGGGGTGLTLSKAGGSGIVIVRVGV